MTDVRDVESFWNANPLWTGESEHPAGTKEFFEEHRSVYLKDCFAGDFDIRFLPPPRSNGQQLKLLDLGCGIGFWTTEFGQRGFSNITAADLTQNALDITKIRLEHLELSANLCRENAECLSFEDSSFDHVNCQGVIHHTPETQEAISEIARVLTDGGTASISVYYRNIFFKLWPVLRWLGWCLSKLGGGLKGRGRENIFLESDVDEIVRLYDGENNPLGKSYSRQQFIDMLAQHFIIEETYLHFFPARALPFKVPHWLHKWLDRMAGFMIYATLKKK